MRFQLFGRGALICSGVFVLGWFAAGFLFGLPLLRGLGLLRLCALAFCFACFVYAGRLGYRIGVAVARLARSVSHAFAMWSGVLFLTAVPFVWRAWFALRCGFLVAAVLDG